MAGAPSSLSFCLYLYLCLSSYRYPSFVLVFFLVFHMLSLSFPIFCRTNDKEVVEQLEAK